MANMFSGKKDKHIPTSLAECTREDATVSNLHLWAERLETLGKVLFIILIVVGIIATIAEGITTAEYFEEMESSVSKYELAAAGIELPSVLDVVVSSILKWSLFAYLEYCIYHVMALTISALASITQNTMITANVALFGAYQENAVPAASQQAMPATTPTTASTPNKRFTPAPPNMWTCRDCGTQNKVEHGQCKKCGKYRS